MDLSEDQQHAWDVVNEWFFDKPDVRCAALAGLAGTGKTTVAASLMRHFASRGVRCLSAAPFGRAASALRKKGVPANTLCSMLYSFAGSYLDADGNEQMRFRDRDWNHNCDVLFVDEASQVDTRTFKDLMAKDVRTLFIGDHGQLRPVGSDPRIMSKPTVCLERIHRQAEGSNILRAAYWARQDRSLPLGESSDVAIREIESLEHAVSMAGEEDVDCLVTGMNRTRFEVNRLMRRRTGRLSKDPPEPGEPILCRRNDHERDVFNGEVYTVDEYKGTYPRYHVLTLRDEFGKVLPGEFRCYRDGFDAPETVLKMDLLKHESYFEWGYAMTCHVMQGSEAPRGLVIDEPFGDVPAWRYTAFTRFSERLVVGRKARGFR